MRWFRDNMRQGSWLALLALVINLGLSFGHVHATDVRHAGSGFALTVVASSDADRTQDHSGDTGADCLCPICIAISAMATALASTPPVLPVAFAGLGLDRPIESPLAFAERPTAAFQSRGPPIS